MGTVGAPSQSSQGQETLATAIKAKGNPGEVLTGALKGREPYRIVGYLDSRRRLGL